MAETINAGQTLPMTLQFTDTAGNVTQTWPTDKPPVWSDTPAGATVDTLTQTADGMSATALGLPAGGADTISVNFTANGVPFSADLALTVNAAAPPPPPPPPTLASVAIVPGTPTP